MAAFTRVRMTIGAVVAAATLGLVTTASAQIVVGGAYPYPGYRYAAPDAAVKFDVKPKETMVYVDGFYAGIVDDFDGVFQRLRTQPGGHQLTLYLEGYRTYSEQVYLAADNTFKLRHRMEKLPAGEASQRPPAPQPPQYQPGQPGPDQGPQPVPYGRGGRRGQAPYPPPGAPAFPPEGRGGDANVRGTLSLTLQPGDADVLLDGQLRRGTPSGDRLTFELSPGRHNIQIRKAGYIGYLTDVQIRQSEATELDVRLKPQP